MTSDDLKAEIDRRFQDAKLGSKLWSFAFHATFGLATIMGVVVAAISGRHAASLAFDSDAYVPVIAMIGSISSAVGIFGGFERKWKANWLTRDRLDILRVEVAYGRRVAEAVPELIDILRTHDAAILREGTGAAEARSRTLEVGAKAAPDIHERQGGATVGSNGPVVRSQSPAGTS